MIDLNNALLNTQGKKDISSFSDSANPHVTNINLQNSITLDEISEGFERENRRYNHSLEL